jgi:hypothetical protein
MHINPMQLPTFTLHHMFLRICVMAILSVLITASSLANAATGLALPNSSFEELDAKTALPANWTPWSPDTVAAYTLARASDGVASLLITDDSATVGHGVRSDRVAAMPGRTYRATGSVFIETLKAGGFAIYIEFWSAAGERLANRSASTTQSGKWVNLTAEAVAPERTAFVTVLCYGGSTTVGAACFDGMNLSVLP